MPLLQQFANALRDALRPPPRPAAASFRFTGAKTMALRIQVNLTAPKAADVKSRELTYTIDGTSHTTSLNPANDPPFTFLAPEGSQITGSVVDVDDKGNRSEPSEVTTFAAVDTFPPPKPDAPAFQVVGQE